MDENENKLSANSTVEIADTNNIINDARAIINAAQKAAHVAVNAALVQRNWLLGKRISEEILKENDRAEYGKALIETLAEQLTKDYKKGFSKRELYKYLQFYRLFPQIVDSASPQSHRLLSWTHYRTLLRVEDKAARDWYVHEALDQDWSVRTLDRNISTQYYYRLLKTDDRHKGDVEAEMARNTAEYQDLKLEFIKDPYVTEFLGFKTDEKLLESDLENAIIENLQQFLLELGKGFAFVARQQRVKTDIDEFYIDLVFYNIILKCYVLIDLKIGKITPQDVGQMDLYVRMFDDLKRGEGDNPTIGIVLCSETSETVARYSVLHDSDQLFASKYKLVLPSEEELRAEIEAQKALFEMRHNSWLDDDDSIG